MNKTEWRGILSLIPILGINVLGFWMVLPVFFLYAQQYKGSTPLLMGIALGIFGLGYAVFHILFGALSHAVHRKLVITITLLIFGVGSALASIATNIDMVILGRLLQGAGAVCTPTFALLNDLTRPEVRLKVNAMVGVTISFSFCLAIILGPVIEYGTDLNGLFSLSAVLTILAIALLWLFVPNPKRTCLRHDQEFVGRYVVKTLKNCNLMKLNIGGFLINAILLALFSALPLYLRHELDITQLNLVWVYLSSSIFAFIAMIIIASLTAKHLKCRLYVSVVCIIVSICLMWFEVKQIWLLGGGLFLFFLGVLLAVRLIPQWISQNCDVLAIGTAKNILICFQGVGAFIGALIAGFLLEVQNVNCVFGLILVLALLWGLIAVTLTKPPQLATRLLSVDATEDNQLDVEASLMLLPGIAEAEVVVEENTAYIRVDSQLMKEEELRKWQKAH